MAIQNVNNLSYTLSLNILKALGGDTSASYESVDDIWGAINDIYDATGDRVDIEALVMTYTENGSFQYYPTETADAYAPVLIDVAVPQKYTDEQVAELQQQSYDDGIDAQKALLKPIEFNENGTYTSANGWNEVTVNTPKGLPQDEVDRLVDEAHTIGINTGKLMQQELMESTTFTDNGTYTREDGWNSVTVNVDKGISNEEFNEQMQISYDAGYDKGIADGYVQGETAGYSDGYSEGLEDGAEDQKALLESTTITENGTYTKEDGWNEVVVAVEGSGEIGQLTDLYLSYDQPNMYEEIQAGVDDWEGIAGFNRVIVSVSVPTEGYTQEDLDIAASEGYQNGYNDGHDEGWTAGFVDGEESVRSGFQSIEITENGTYIEDGGGAWNEITVNVAGGGGSGKPKIYNGFRLHKRSNAYETATLSDFRSLDFSQYDWSGVYDLSSFFADFNADYNGAGFTNSDFESFRNHYNGDILSLTNAFTKGAAGYDVMYTIPNLGEKINNCLSLEYAFSGCNRLNDASILSNWNTSKVVSTSYMFSGCSALTTVPLFDTSKVVKMDNMFNSCTALTTVPLFDTSKVTNMNNMFASCRALTTIPEFDFSNVIDAGQMFQGCSGFTSIGNINCEKLTSFGGQWSNWRIANSQNILSVGVIDATSIEDAYYALGDANKITVTDFGGLRNLGTYMSISNTNNCIANCPNFTKESLLNVFNLLYDRAAAGYTTIPTLKLHADCLARLSEEDIAIATNKGWTIA